MNQLISIVIPTYNHADFLKTALDSVLNQTYQNWEVLVVNNHSEDNTSEVISGFNDKRICEFKIHNNGVIAASRNLGINNAKGEWVAFLDSDDLWYPGKLEVFAKIINSDDKYDVFCHDELMVDKHASTKRVLRHGPFHENFYKTLLIGGNRLSTSAVMIRRDFLMHHKLLFNEAEKFVTVEDYDLWLNLARVNAHFKFVKEVQGEYIIHGNNCSANLTKHWANCESMLHEHVFFIQEFNSKKPKFWKVVSSRLVIEQARQYFTRKQFFKVFKLLSKAIIFNPYGTVVYLLSKAGRRLITV